MSGLVIAGFTQGEEVYGGEFGCWVGWLWIFLFRWFRGRVSEKDRQCGSLKWEDSMYFFSFLFTVSKLAECGCIFEREWVGSTLPPWRKHWWPLYPPSHWLLAIPPHSLMGYCYDLMAFHFFVLLISFFLFLLMFIFIFCFEKKHTCL